MTPCPPASDLQCLLSDQLSDPERMRIEAHVENCDVCQDTLNSLVLSAPGLAPPYVLSTLSDQPTHDLTTEGEFFLEQLKRKALTIAPQRPTSAGPASTASGALPEVEGYDILNEVGRGAVGVVYRARHRELNRLVALKMIAAGPHLPPEARLRLRREAQAIARLRHPNIVQVYDVDEHAGYPYLALELVEGENLDRWLGGVPRPATEAARIVVTMAEAVAYAHSQGVIHRDLKPANVLLGAKSGYAGPPSGKNSSAQFDLKITDFGLARILPGLGPAEDRVTESGMILGTPAYIAPEQAQGRSTEVGPAVDIYSLGAILYELLTGRLPFEGPTAMAVLLRAAHEEPLPPSRLVPHLPRALDTICLKCLEKAPAKRYVTAGELAADLDRFLKDQPIRARPVGRFQRHLRWLRRRPTQAVLVGANLFLAIVLAGGGLRVITERSATFWAAEAGFREVDQLRTASAWDQANARLDQMEAQFAHRGPAELRERLASARRDLDQTRRDTRLAARLDVISLNRATMVAIDNEHLDPAGERRCNDARADRDYAAAFQEAGFAERHDAPQNEAARVASSVVRTALLAGLDDWAACTADKNRRNWLLTIARLADANAARDPAAGNNPSSVADMTKSIIVTSQSVPTLIMVGERLRATGGDAISFLSEVQKAHPDDFRANVTLGNFLSEPEPDMAARYYRQALAIRPQSAMAYNNLGHISYNAHQWEQAIVDYQRALQVDASFGPAYNNLGLVLKKQGKWDQATERFREAVRLDPQSATCHVNLADIQAASGKLNDAIDHYQIAIRLDPGFAQAHYMLGLALPPGARLDHAILVHDQALRESPENLRAHGIVFGHSQDVALGHYKAAVLFDPTWAPGHFILGTGQLGDDRVDEAIGHFQRAIELSPGLAYAHGSLGQALLAQGHFREAQAATRRCLELLSERDDARTNLAGQLERCQLLLTLDERLPGILDGQRKPADTAESIAFADLCVLKRQYVSAARLYADRLTPTFGPAEDTIPDFHLRAVRAAILAGSGCGEEGAKLGPAEQARWLEQARAWLRAGLATLTKQLDGGYTVVRNLIMPTLGTWQIEPELVWLRNHDTSSELSPEDRHHFRALWNDVFDLFQRCLGRLSRR